MKKYFLKETGTPLELGKPFTITHKFKDGDTFLNMKMTLTFTKSIIPIMKRHGLIEEKEVEEKDLNYYFKKLQKRLGYKEPGMCNLYMRLAKTMPSVLFQMFLKEVALDKAKSLSDLDKVYIISLADGNIYTIGESKIKCYSNFAGFRTQEDAEDAKRILKPLLDLMFNDY